MRLWIAALGCALLLLSLAMGGTAPLGRVALSLGLPNVAVPLLTDPHWRGVALYRSGRFQKAANAFAEAGPEAAFNLGNARAQKGSYAAALEAYDLAGVHRSDPEAQANFDLVLAIYAGTRIEADTISRWGERGAGPTAEGEVARGSARASGTGDEVTNTGPSIGLPALQSREQRGVRKVFDDTFVVASPRWLATLSDTPGAFLTERIRHEHKRRKLEGIGQPDEGTEW